MSTRRNVVLAGVVGLILAIAVIAGSMVVGILPPINVTPTGQKGTLSILLTDPSYMPEGVSAVYVSYFDLQVHIADAGNQSGWTTIQTAGTVNLTGTINYTQTLSSIQIQQGVYNALRFNVSGAQVTFNGVNYTAFVPTARLLVPIIGGIVVNASKPSAVIIDITPTVINIGSNADPEFIIRHVDRAYPVPPSQVATDMENVGYRMYLNDQSWWRGISEESTANLTVTSASLSANSLSVSVLDKGADTTLKLVVVSPLVASPLFIVDGRNGRLRNAPNALAGSAIFVIEENGTLESYQRLARSIMSMSDRDQVVTMLGGVGYSIASGASATFTYSVQIQLGFGMGMRQSNTIVSGQQYLVTVMGDGALASYVATAG